MLSNKKLIVVLGPTASGKSALAVKLAKRFNGEVVSADSRQVYRGMDIGTGKITQKEMRGIPHHLLDVASPKRIFTVVQYRKLALKAINKIFEKNKLPILCGGTGFYIQAVVNGLVIPPVKPDWKLRKKLEKKSVSELYRLLKKLDPRRAKNIDKNNPRRLIRALEIVLKIGPVPILRKNALPYAILMLGVKKTPGELKILIAKRLLKRLKQGMIEEVRMLRKAGISWKRLEAFGLEYRWVARFLRTAIMSGSPTSLNIQREVGLPNIRESDFFNRLQKNIEHFAKRQMTWFKRDKRIHWVKNYQEAERLVKKFIN